MKPYNPSARWLTGVFFSLWQNSPAAVGGPNMDLRSCHPQNQLRRPSLASMSPQSFSFSRLTRLSGKPREDLQAELLQCCKVSFAPLA